MGIFGIAKRGKGIAKKIKQGKEWDILKMFAFRLIASCPRLLPSAAFSINGHVAVGH